MFARLSVWLRGVEYDESAARPSYHQTLETLAEAEDPDMLPALRVSSALRLGPEGSTRTGRPNGGKRFIARLQSLRGRALLTKPRGRPRKPNTKMKGN